jgi:hypothetical protein
MLRSVGKTLWLVLCLAAVPAGCGDRVEAAGPECHQEDCGPREECLGKYGGCFEVECGSVTPCLDPSNICDESQLRCFPANGACSDEVVCPDFGISSTVAIDCGKDKLCHATSKGALLPAPVSAPAELAIVSPNPGDHFATVDEIHIEWDATVAVVLVELLKGDGDLPNSIVWGATLPLGGASSVDWTDGHSVVHGEWVSGHPNAINDGLYYVLVQAVKSQDLVAASLLVPIQLGTDSTWKDVGESCSQEGVPGDCFNPAAPQACVDGSCERVCASHADCAPLRCQAPIKGIRVCG